MNNVQLFKPLEMGICALRACNDSLHPKDSCEKNPGEVFSVIKKVGHQAVNLLEDERCPFPRLFLFAFRAYSAFFLLSFSFLLILSAAFHMNSLF
ncbi:hypothetical protein SAMN02745220_00490 [Desulfopila aestuarii DSM 18488]|uniref:Uncharacterized protein n=1 Tax=Desulfopila aestuarii DSM 18488 TaxID=1121416 RepID=A0A1M7XXQ8_9BACT|nr:hypothetical protein SAMN02745220_00490 [Desulfopila aestuarii DSM 18488]